MRGLINSIYRRNVVLKWNYKFIQTVQKQTHVR
nr:MAG TPA_asm: hypothetical protein [Caudoviricetes sp.]